MKTNNDDKGKINVINKKLDQNDKFLNKNMNTTKAIKHVKVNIVKNTGIENKLNIFKHKNNIYQTKQSKIDNLRFKSKIGQSFDYNEKELLKYARDFDDKFNT